MLTYGMNKLNGISEMINNLYNLRSKVMYDTINCLIKDFEQNSINYVIVKGEPLSFYCYKEFGKRVSSDIDFLVSSNNLNKVESILLKNGYIQVKSKREYEIFTKLYSHQIISFSKKVVYLM